MPPPSGRRPAPRRTAGEVGGLTETTFEALTAPARQTVPAPGASVSRAPARPHAAEPPASGPVEVARPARAPVPAAARRRPRRVVIDEESQVSLSVEEVSSVRPFVVTGGRTQGSTDTRLESILEVANQQWLADKGKKLSREESAIVRQIATTYLTVAEVSAHLKLPVGVVKVLVSDLAESGVLVVHDTMAGGGGVDSGGPVSREQTLELLESVLNAISKL
ncbi:MAG: DUF742 domain-containing protein [Bifidobacteriaceae bacterium]|nr:DUF742 domain-containing protein [Bifidobacteriaceae bacterium]